MKMMKLFGLVVIALCSAVMMCGCGNKESGRQAACLSNLKQFGTALAQFESAYGGCPTRGIEGMEALRKDYMDAPKIFLCPSAKDTAAGPGCEITEKNCSFIYLGSEKLNTSGEKGSFPVIIEHPQNHSDGVGILMLDWAVKRVKTKEKSAVKILQAEFNNGKDFNPENWKIAIEEAAKWDKKNGL